MRTPFGKFISILRNTRIGRYGLFLKRSIYTLHRTSPQLLPDYERGRIQKRTLSNCITVNPFLTHLKVQLDKPSKFKSSSFNSSVRLEQ